MSKYGIRRGYRVCYPEMLELRLNLSPVWMSESRADDDGGQEVSDDRESSNEVEHLATVALVPGEETHSPEKHDVADEGNANFVGIDSYGDDVVALPVVSQLPAEQVNSKVSTANNEVPAFDDLEALLEDAHYTGANVQLADQHMVFLDDVIAHLADELLVPAADLRGLVPTRDIQLQQPDTGEPLPSAALTAEPAEAEAVGVGAAKSTEAAISVFGTPVTTVSDTSDEAASTEQLAVAVEAIRTDIPGTPVKAASVAGDVVAERIVLSRVEASSGGSAESASVPDNHNSTPVDAAMAPLNIAARNLAELPVPGLGIRYGSALGLLNQGIRLPFDAGQELRNALQNTSTAALASTDSSGSLLAAAALALGTLAAANADRDPTVQRIARRIRRSIRPAV